jgi:hypothetical protein
LNDLRRERKLPVNSLFLRQNLRIWAEIEDLDRRYAKMPVNFPVPAKFAVSAFGFRLFWWLYRASVGRGKKVSKAFISRKNCRSRAQLLHHFTDYRGREIHKVLCCKSAFRAELNLVRTKLKTSGTLGAQMST